MNADDLSAPSGWMTLLRIISGAMHKIGPVLFWTRLMLTGSMEARQKAVGEALLAGLNDFAAGFAAEIAEKEALAGDGWDEPEDGPAAALMWKAVGRLVLTDEEYALERDIREWERADRLHLWLKVYPRCRALYWARLKARLAVWRGFAALLRLLSALSQIRDEKPVWALSRNCDLFVPIS